LESVWAKQFTSDVEDAAEEPTTCRKSDVRHAAMENPQESNAIHGRIRNTPAKEHVSLF